MNNMLQPVTVLCPEPIMTGRITLYYFCYLCLYDTNYYDANPVKAISLL